MKVRSLLGHSSVAVVALLAAGCGGFELPPIEVAPASPRSASRYAVRTDLMVIKLLDGAPKRWPSAGFPPLKSARNPSASPDREIAADLRAQIGKNILDPQRDLNAGQSALFPGMLEAGFGTPAEPRVRVPEWNTKWEARLRADWETAKTVKEELKLDDAALARGSVLYRRWCLQCHGPTGAGDGAQAIEPAALPRLPARALQVRHGVPAPGGTGQAAAGEEGPRGKRQAAPRGSQAHDSRRHRRLDDARVPHALRAGAR
jgi:mono/diheme cytochrome c family protein